MGPVKTSSLALAVIHRNGDGETARRRLTFDFEVDGQSLAQLLSVRVSDLVGRLDAEHRDLNATEISVLVGDAPADLAADRVLLFVCPECGDVKCGAVTATLNVRNDLIEWSDFRYENTYDEAMTKRFVAVGPFRFARDAYCRILAGAR